ncbi:MAG: hypothetical protein QXG08_08070 [Candidatus Methanomethyliaceae archaeon]
MPLAFEVLCGRATAPGSTATTLTPLTGDSFVIKNSVPGKRVFLGNACARIHSGTTGVLRIRSPKLHDNVLGLNWALRGGHSYLLMPLSVQQNVFPQDVLVLDITGSGTAGAIEHGGIMVWYEDLPGVTARLTNYGDIAARIKNIFTVRAGLTPSTTGDYSGTKAINADYDLFKANVDYALLGYKVTAEAFMIGIRGPDTGNLRIGMPAAVGFEDETEEFFIRLNERWKVPTIPVINGSNKFSTTLDVVQDETGTGTTVTLIMAELG